MLTIDNYYSLKHESLLFSFAGTVVFQETEMAETPHSCKLKNGQTLPTQNKHIQRQQNDYYDDRS